MTVALYYLAWEWINIAVEYTSVAWARLPHLLWAVVGVNLVTHPAFVLLLECFGRSPCFVIPCEIAIVAVEFALLAAIYGFARWRLLLAASFVMNATSYGTGVLLALAG